MRKIKIFAFVPFVIGAAIVSVAFINCKSGAKTSHSDNLKFDGKGFALVELFTSEGCSSCPPADELVAKVQKEVGDKPVYILAYHVDYWNRLGWKDIFSSADYSKRQNEYARWLNLSQVYTPQIVVNGKTEFVGSQEERLRNAIKSSLQGSDSVQLNLSVTISANNTASVQYKVEGNAENARSVISLALVQKQAVVKVERGENGGRTLAHAQIVRNLQTMPLNKNNGSATIALPARVEAREWEVIGFVQKTSNGAVLAASKSLVKVSADVGQQDKNVQ
ncbi:DUF1223 domain-containing protein [Mucilaginibacter rubeus]|uniref:DUF1223 domain-containing protein n=1 Tax=Mucilaginibacter rubeus TaxID=2027860 RepID=A0AAE6JJ81_9SPHI|nr:MULTISPECIES: DUF1223 domain-containing protein [Mucilaginibacter]QEM06804.1 DUF1223 domain-containing protein [Mucilaginibacter rubeus]QEM19391.1 DUF1223 domain-containing protein [Mucilaginibacter gossypii]QTE44061.1 DUF1223 domain-containing protein [Mucilaginibacter rubeus]QTE50662.1 DUF1223 domain-containing protein [Mucilaginibacter rubeus]QTE55745.1 DUF1223 domain-containing protein [Mucilaginibacter rubeus]